MNRKPSASVLHKHSASFLQAEICHLYNLVNQLIDNTYLRIYSPWIQAALRVSVSFLYTIIRSTYLFSLSWFFLSISLQHYVRLCSSDD